MSDDSYRKPKVRQHLKVMKRNYPTLYAAWQLFARFDKDAGRLKFWLRFLQIAVLVLGVITPVLVIYDLYWGDQTAFFQYVLIVLPLLLSALLLYANRLGRSGKWFFLRAAADRVKREIYSFRAGVGDYADPQAKGEQLAFRLEALYRRLAETEPTMTGLALYDEQTNDLPLEGDYFSGGDDGASPISAEEYIRFRLDSQINFYQKRVNYLDKNLQVINLLILLAGVVGAILAAAGLALWVVVTTAAVLALLGYMQSHQMTDRLTSSSQTVANLEAIKIWWAALDNNQQALPEACEKLVTDAEDVLNAEMMRWIPAEEVERFERTEVITDGAYYGPTDGPDSDRAVSYDEPRDISPSELVTISPDLEEKFPLDDEEDDSLKGEEEDKGEAG